MSLSQTSAPVSPLLVLVLSTITFSCSDVMARHYMHRWGFHWETFLMAWFWVYTTIRFLATVGQLYVLATVDLSKALTLAGLASLTFANVMGILLFKEVLSVSGYVALTLAFVAFTIMAFRI